MGFPISSRGRSHPLLPESSAAELNCFYVQRPSLSQGIGKVLLARAETLAREEGAAPLWLTAWTGNAHALRFYASQGYQDAGASVYTFEGDSFETRYFEVKSSRRSRRPPRAESCPALLPPTCSTSAIYSSLRNCGSGAWACGRSLRWTIL